MSDQERRDAAAIYNKIADIGSAYICLSGDRFCASPEYSEALHQKIEACAQWNRLSLAAKRQRWRTEDGEATDFFDWLEEEENDLAAGHKFAVDKLAEVSKAITDLNSMADAYARVYGKSWRLHITDNNMAFCIPPERG